MATTFNEEYSKALGERGLALVGKRTAVQMGIDARKRRDDLEQILFGDGTNYGVVSVLSIMYSQVWLIAGKSTSKPVLYDPSQAKSQYQSEFSLSVSPAGDGAGGLHPPQQDIPDVGQDEVDSNSVWLVDHALETVPSGNGVIQLINSLKEVIGVVASVNSNGRGPYATQGAAQAQAALDRGSGFLGIRTENSEIYSTGTSPSLQWWVGQNGITTPDNYTQKSSLVSALTNIQNKINSLIAVLQQELDMMNGVNGAILQEFKVDLPDDTDLSDSITQAQGFVAQIQSYIDYFNQYSDPSSSANRSEINSKLSEVLNYSTTIVTALNNRVADITSGMLGDASSGINKHLVFWVSEIVAKPDGPYAMILAASDMLSQSEQNLSQKNDRLQYFITDHSKWIEIPLIQSIYDRAVMNLDQVTINRWEVDIIWNLIMSANKYKILSKPLSQITSLLNNDPWDDSEGFWVVDMLPSTFLRNLLTIAPPTETTFFRLVAYDTSQGDSGDFERMDTFDTNSLQSDIISDPITFTQKNSTQIGQSVIEVDASAGLKERDFLMVNNAEIAQVMAITDNQYALDTDYGDINQIQKLFGLYFKEPEE